MSGDPLESLIGKVKKTKGVENAMVVSRSGMHVAGSAPDKVHMETFVAMSAIVLGAAETAAAELQEDLESVEVRAGGKVLLMTGLGSKGILVLEVGSKTEPKDLLAALSKEIERMREALS